MASNGEREVVKKSRFSSDRSMEMANHKDFAIATQVKIYFCGSRSSWQHGTDENTNHLLRQHMPHRMQHNQHSLVELNRMVAWLDEGQRKNWASCFRTINAVRLLQRLIRAAVGCSAAMSAQRQVSGAASAALLQQIASVAGDDHAQRCASTGRTSTRRAPCPSRKRRRRLRAAFDQEKRLSDRNLSLALGSDAAPTEARSLCAVPGSGTPAKGGRTGIIYLSPAEPCFGKQALANIAA